VEGEYLMMAWREPPGWSPIWVRDEKVGVMIIVNEPERRFYFDRTTGRQGHFCVVAAKSSILVASGAAITPMIRNRKRSWQKPSGW
jgi:hypothetical protein